MIAAAQPRSACYATAVRRSERLGSLAAWASLFVTAIVFRALRFGLIFGAGGVQFPHGADEMYHMRRIWFSVVNFPASLDFDRYVDFPHGARCVWPPLFDWCIAAVARLLVGKANQGAVEVVAVWAPPVIGACAVLATAWLARRAFSPAAGWLSGALLAVLPGHIFYSALGEVDHHVAVGLLAVLLVAASMRLATPPGADWRRAAIVAGGVAALAILLWPGSLLYVLVVQAYLTVQLLATGEKTLALARARSLGWMHAVTGAALAPFCFGRSWEQFGAMSPLVLSDFQPLWFLAGAATFALAAALWSRSGLGARRGQRLGSALGLAAVGLAAAWFGLPGLRDALANAITWFEPDPGFLDVVAEMQPLFLNDGHFEAGPVHEYFSYLAWALPLALAWLGREALRARRGDVGLLLVWSAAAWGLAIYQQRFCDTASPFFALVMGSALAEGTRSASARWPARRALVAAGAALCGLALLTPYLPQFFLKNLDVSLRVRRGERMMFQTGVRQLLVMERVGRWLKRETPPTAGYLDASAAPEYGVLAAWGQGHLLRYLAERPMVEDNFGPYAGPGYAAARAYYASRDEESGAEIAERLGARYVVAAPQGSGQSWPARDSLARRLSVERGRPIAPLSRHRLLFIASDVDLVRERGIAPFAVAVYEVVRGALVAGRAPGAFDVSFETSLDVGTGVPVRYHATALVDAAGAYEIRLPHPTAYTVRAGAEAAPLSLSDADVREGRTVAGPSFGPAGELSPRP